MTLVKFVLQQQPWLQNGSYQTSWRSAGRLDWYSKDKVKMYLYHCANHEDVWGRWRIAPLTLKTKVGRQHHAPAALNPWRTRGTHITKLWVDVRDLEGSKKKISVARTRIRSPVRPARILVALLTELSRLNSRGVRLESGPIRGYRHWNLSWFSSVPHENVAWLVCRLGYNHFLPNLLQFLIHLWFPYSANQ